MPFELHKYSIINLLDQTNQAINEIENIQEDLLESSLEFQVLGKAKESYEHAKMSLAKLI